MDAARDAGGKVAMHRCIDASAADFYRHHDFEPHPNRCDRLVLKLSTAGKSSRNRLALNGRSIGCDFATSRDEFAQEQELSAIGTARSSDTRNLPACYAAPRRSQLLRSS